jgi:hypothetical protein
MTSVDVDTGRRPRRLVITRDDAVDCGFLFGLGIIALIGFRTTYGGTGYLVVGVAGLVLGIAIAYLSQVLRQPAITVGAMSVVVFFLFGGALALHGQAAGGVLPTGGTLRSLALVSVDGWKDLLTTVPPVGTGGGLLAIPYILGLLGGAAGFTLSRRFVAPAVAAIAPVVMLATVILLGADRPAARLLQGMVFALAALIWIAERAQRRRPPVQNGAGRRIRTATAVGVVAVTALGTGLIGSHLPGASSHPRVVLRSYVEPPFDINAYPSPLAGFREYTKDAAEGLYSSPLFTVRGIPTAYQGKIPFTIATLDAYDGSVWGATNGSVRTAPGQQPDVFERVGSQIASTADGTPLSLSVAIDAAYADQVDSDAWVPTAGQVNSVSFPSTDNDSADLAAGLRFNPATQSTVVPSLLRTNDQYVIQTDVAAKPTPIQGETCAATIPEPLAASAGGFGQPSVQPDLLPSSGFTAAINAASTKWEGTSGQLGKELDTVALYLHNNGYYSDGGTNERQYYPGHSIYRLSQFLGVGTLPLGVAPLVGDDEQYAATFALLSNELGMPARVALVGVPEPGSGVVKGSDVHAWVQVHLIDGSWVNFPSADFTPCTKRIPKVTQPPTSPHNITKAIPPPVSAHPPSTAFDTGKGRTFSSRRSSSHHHSVVHIPRYLRGVVKWGGPPAFAILAWIGLIVGLKARRRHVRRTQGPTTRRFAMGWHEVVDQATDLGAKVPEGLTRREQASGFADPRLRPIAETADAGVFGPGTPSEEAAAVFWTSVDLARRQMVRAVGRSRRIRAALSLRSFRRPSRRRPRPADATS